MQPESPHLNEVEQNKERFNMRPHLEFVERHLPIFQKNLDAIMARPIDPVSAQLVQKIRFENVEYDDSLQITPQEVRDIFSRLPASLLQVSHLQAIDYTDQKKVPVPLFDDNGNWTYQTEYKDYTDTEIQRMLIGRTTQKGTIITPTAIPAGVSTNKDAIRFSQIHVMLHEFFHTIEIPLRDPHQAETLILEYPDGTLQSFADWRTEFFESLQQEPEFSSMYSETYKEELKDPKIQAYALAEQMAEAFSAYVLDIICNNQDYTSFSGHSFGNKDSRFQLFRGYGSLRHELMDRFFHAQFFTAENIERHKCNDGEKESEYLTLSLNGETKFVAKRAIPQPMKEQILSKERSQEYETLKSLLPASVFERIFYPACGPDSMLNTHFPESEIWHIDPSAQNLFPVHLAITSPNQHCVISTAENFQAPYQASMIVFRNTNGMNNFDFASKHLQSGGYLIDSFWGSIGGIEQFFESPDFEFVGYFKNEQLVTDIESVQKMLQTPDEYNNAFVFRKK